MSHPNPQPPARVYAAALESYYQLGWNGILPLPVGQKSPPPEGFTGWTGDWPSYADLYAWAEERPGANVGLRMPEHVIGIDVDNYSTKTGGTTLAAKEAEWGTLPPTWRSTSRDDGVSGIRFYSIPTGLEWVTGLPSIELIHFGHRYAVVAPSIHPEGRPYRWIDPDGTTSLVNPSAHDMPPLPASWILGLAKGPHQGQARADLDNDAAWTWIQALPGHNAASCTFMAEWAAKAVREMGETRESRHDVTRGQVLKLVRFAESGHRGIEPALDRVRAAFIRIVIGDNSRTMREASSEWGRILTGAVRIIVANPEPSVVEGDPCGPVIATLRVPSRPAPSAQPRPTSPDLASPRPADPGEPKTAVPPAETPSAITEPRLTSPEPEEEPHSWIRKDLQRLLQNPPAPIEPLFLTRTDGKSLFYPGKVNGIIGASEGAKTWLMLLGVVQAVQAGRNVGYLDFEDDWDSITKRLLALGLTAEQIWTYVAYLNPEQAFDATAETHLREMLNDHRPELVVLDGVNAAMTLNGWDLLSNKDATLFSQKILKPIARCPWLPAATYVDHLPKNPTEAGGAIGAQAKRAMTTGCAIKVEVARVFGKGQRGELILTVDKDRSGSVRGLCPEGSSALGVARLTSNPDGTLVSIHIEPATKAPQFGTSASLRPTMEAISRFLEGKPEPVSGANIERFVRGVSTDTKRDAVERLLIEKYVRLEPVGRYMHHVSIRPYRTDPFGSESSTDQTSPGSPDLAWGSPGEVAEWSKPRLSGASPEEGFTGEAPRAAFSDLESETSPGVATSAGPSNLGFNDDGNLVDLDTGEIIDQNDID